MKRISLCLTVCLLLLLAGAGSVFAGYFDVNYYDLIDEDTEKLITEFASTTDDPDATYREIVDSLSNIPAGEEVPNDSCYEISTQVPTLKNFRFAGWRPVVRKVPVKWEINIITFLSEEKGHIEGEGYVGDKIPIHLPASISYDQAYCGVYPFVISFENGSESFWGVKYFGYQPQPPTYQAPSVTAHSLSDLWPDADLSKSYIVSSYFTDKFYDDYPDGVPAYMILDEDSSKNFVTIIYQREPCHVAPGDTTLAVRCMNAETETELPYGEVMEDLKAGEEITVSAPEIEGFYVINGPEQRFTPAANAEENVVTFWYEPEANVSTLRFGSLSEAENPDLTD